MIRRIIEIDRDKCDGCGICATACHEGAIGIVDGKAKLLRDDYCDGLGDCLPTCPTGAIYFVEREALAYDEASVLENMKKKQIAERGKNLFPSASKQSENSSKSSSCPSAKVQTLSKKTEKSHSQNFATISNKPNKPNPFPAAKMGFEKQGFKMSSPKVKESELSQWPIQIKLAPVNAPFFNDADLLIAADCTAYAYASFHKDFIKGKVTLIGCPKLDDEDYAQKLEQIINNNNIKSISVVRMQVPCCMGLERYVKAALKNVKKIVPTKITVISLDGEIVE